MSCVGIEQRRLHHKSGRCAWRLSGALRAAQAALSRRARISTSLSISATRSVCENGGAHVFARHLS